MQFIAKFKQLIWPHITPAVDEKYKSHQEAIKSASWSQPEIILEEARRLSAQENTRKEKADTKGQIYIGVLLAIIPILFSMTELDIVKDRFAQPSFIIVWASVILTCALLYGLGALFYAFRTLRVSEFARVDVDELLDFADREKLEELITKEILLSVRYTRRFVNEKVGYVGLTQKHLARMVTFFIFGSILIITEPLLVTFFKHLSTCFC